MKSIKNAGLMLICAVNMVAMVALYFGAGPALAGGLFDLFRSKESVLARELQSIAAEMQRAVPQSMGDGRTLTNVTVEGVRMVYHVRMGRPYFSETLNRSIIEAQCSHYWPLFAKGVEFETRITDSRGVVSSAVTKPADCR